MSRSVLLQTARESWYLVVGIAVVLVALAYRFVFPGDAPGEPPPRPAATGAPAATAPLVLPAAPPMDTLPEARVRDLIAGYEERLANAPDDPDAPAVLMAMGNLYRDRLVDFEQAAIYFEQALAEHPDFASRRDLYIQLADCYERLGRLDMRDAVYRDIMAEFPPDSEEYLYARDQLGQ